MPISHVTGGCTTTKMPPTTDLSCLTPGISEAGIPRPRPIVAVLLFTWSKFDRTPGSEFGRVESGETPARSPELGELSGLTRLFCPAESGAAEFSVDSKCG